MKKIFALGMVLMMALSTFGSAAFSPASAACETTPQVVTLFAGQHIDVGTVTVDNDLNNLYVTFATSGDWWLQKTHLHVAELFTDIPVNNKGNPKIGNFAYQTTHDPRVQSYTYTIPMSALSLDVNGSLVIAAHAEVVKIVDGEIVQEETGWGDGDTFVDRGSWAMHFSYSWQDCDLGPKGGSETAYARSDSNNICFLDLDLNGDGLTGNTDPSDPNEPVKKWGWTNGQISGTLETPYEATWQLWAGAAQCDLEKGTFVGTVTVEYDGLQVKVTFTTNSPYYLEETHVYAGPEQMPRNNNTNEYTGAPGQYQFTNMARETFENGETISTTTIDVTGEIYIVAHATVGGFE